MMQILFRVLNDPKKKSIYLLALVFLLFNCWYNLYAVRAVNAALLEEKYSNTQNSVDIICAAFGSLPEEQTPPAGLINSVSALDTVPLTFAAAYRLTETGTLEVISNRDYATDFDPLTYIEFTEAALSSDSGTVTVDFTPENGERRDMLLYYRWAGDRYMIVSGVSKYSVTTHIPAMYTIGQWVSTFVVSALFFVFVLLNAALGYVWFRRGNEPWRDKRDGI